MGKKCNLDSSNIRFLTTMHFTILFLLFCHNVLLLQVKGDSVMNRLHWYVDEMNICYKQVKRTVHTIFSIKCKFFIQCCLVTLFNSIKKSQITNAE